MRSLITLLILTSTLFAKIDTTQNFFPLAVGNIWQYMYDDGRLSRIQVWQDSIDENGYRYFWVSGELYKVSPAKDSIILISGGGYPDRLIYKFPITHRGQWWRVQYDTGTFPITAHVVDIFPISFWGKLTTVADIRYHANLDTTFPTTEWMYTDELADGLGLIWWGWEVEYKTLIGCVIDGDTIGIIVNVDDEKENKPDKFELYQNYPNPFNSSTTISFTILREEFVELSVYNCLGERIKVLKNELLRPGNYTIKFDASGFSSGIYFYRLTTPKGSITKKMLCVK
ncbi:MAG: T9SS type A sorting domain-containing protein [Ignavibacteria bacterium]|nr:T9SS type A sorting domain-containing protein [Ignavibacteria bacterium]